MGTSFKIHGLDLRHSSVEIFCNFIEQKYERLDILINNAAQTVRRPAGFYTHLMANEERRSAYQAYTGFIARSCSLFTGLK
jgi:NAD(P)-dependent dehydrogenase (short-subunit alcohol dehydrogenase family)